MSEAEKSHSLLVDPNKNAPTDNKHESDARIKAGEQGADTDQIIQNIQDLSGTTDLEEIGAAISETSTRVNEAVDSASSSARQKTTEDNTGLNPDSIEIEFEDDSEKTIQDLRDEVIEEFSKDIKFDRETSTFDGKTVDNLSETEPRRILENNSNNIEHENEDNKAINSSSPSEISDKPSSSVEISDPELTKQLSSIAKELGNAANFNQEETSPLAQIIAQTNQQNKPTGRGV